MNDTLFFGFLSIKHPDGLSYFSPPQAPSHYKRPEVIREYIDKARADQEVVAAHTVCAGMLRDACLLDIGGGQRFVNSSHHPGETSVKLLHFLLSHFGEDAFGENSPYHYFVGFGVKEFLRIAAVEYFRYGPPSSLPKNLWSRTSCLIDPYETIVPGTDRNNVGVVGLCKYLGIDTNERDLSSVSGLANAALLLARRTYLVDTTLERE